MKCEATPHSSFPLSCNALSANRTALPGFYSLELNANLFSKESLTMADSKSLRILSVSDAKLAKKSNLQEKFLSQWIYPFSQYPTHPNFQQP